MKLTNNEQWILDYLKVDILPRALVVGVCQFKLADMRSILQTTDEWLRRRIRSYVWKSWKKVGTKFKNLMKCGIDKWRAWQWANTRGGYWNTAGSPILCRAMNNERLKLQGYPCLVDLYIKLHQH